MSSQWGRTIINLGGAVLFATTHLYLFTEAVSGNNERPVHNSNNRVRPFVGHPYMNLNSFK